MALSSMVCTWGSLKIIYLIIMLLNVIGCFIIIGSIVWAVKMNKEFSIYLNFVAPGDGHFWPVIIIAISLLCAPVYIFGIRMCIGILPKHIKPKELRVNAEMNDKKFSQRINRGFFVHAVLCLSSTCLIIIANAAVILCSATFQKKFRDGLLEAIGSYATDVISKSRLDAVQTEFHCCGSDTYRDWFRISWLKNSLDPSVTVRSTSYMRYKKEDLTSETSDNYFASTDVPFSCCSTEVLKPCIHYDILRASDAYDYNPEKRLTIATSGCKSKILTRARTVGYTLIMFLTFLAIYQLILSVFSRLLQTAHSNELYIGPEKAQYHLWILGGRSKINKDDDLSSMDNLSVFSTSASSASRDHGEEKIDDAMNNDDKKKIELLKKICSNLALAGTRSSPLYLSREFRSCKCRDKFPAKNYEGAIKDRNGDRVYKYRKNKKVFKNGKERFLGMRNSSNQTDDYEIKKTIERESDKSSKRMDIQEQTSINSAIMTCKDGSLTNSEYTSDSRINLNGEESENIPSPPPLPRQGILPSILKETETFYSGLSENRRSSLCMMNEDSSHRKRLSGGADNYSYRAQKFYRLREQRSVHSGTERSGKERISSFGRAEVKNICWNKKSGQSMAGGRVLAKFHPSDAYDRFRGTFQDTLARRENKSRARHKRGLISSGRWPPAAGPASQTDSLKCVKRNKILEKLGCKNDFPPCYSLLAKMENASCGNSTAISPPPPPPPLPHFMNLREIRPILPSFISQQRQRIARTVLLGARNSLRHPASFLGSNSRLRIRVTCASPSITGNHEKSRVQGIRYYER